MIRYILLFCFIVLGCGHYEDISHLVNHRNYSHERYQYNISSDDLHILSISPHRLTLTSAGFNYGVPMPNWVHHVYGNKSVFFLHSHIHILDKKMNREDMKLALYHGKNNGLNFSTSSNDSGNNLCSFQLLGFVAVHTEEPFSTSNRLHSDKPIAGIASLVVYDHPYSNNNSHHQYHYHQHQHHSSAHQNVNSNNSNYNSNNHNIHSNSSHDRIHIIHHVRCYYRALYENWRADGKDLLVNYWLLTLYCPIKSMETCTKTKNYFLENKTKFTSLEVSMKLTKVTWTNSIHISNQLLFRYPELNQSTKITEDAIGVCLAVPYQTSDKPKEYSNKVLLSNWVKYYLLLGFKVFVYDHDGANKEILSQYIYHNKDMVYYNFTIRGLLDPESRNMTYDNMIESDKTGRKSRYEKQGRDKALTLSHCRFEAMVTYGIKNIIVSDSDEFIFCPQAGLSGLEQGKFIRNLVWEQSVKLRKDQIIFQQKVLANKTHSIRDCLIDTADIISMQHHLPQLHSNNMMMPSLLSKLSPPKVQVTSIHSQTPNIHSINHPSRPVNHHHSPALPMYHEKSLFDCVASYSYGIGNFLYKSIHLGNNCPMTGFHESCPTSEQPRKYDCLCQSVTYPVDVCSFVHMTTRNIYYAEYSQHINPQNEKLLKNSVNEIKIILDEYKISL